MAKKKELAPVSVGGLVQLGGQSPEHIPLHYCHGKWYGPNRAGGFMSYKDTQAGALIAEYGYRCTQTKLDTGNTPAMRAQLWLMQNRSVAYAGPLAGWPVGAWDMGPQRVLVTEQLQLVAPKPGKWPTIQTLVESLLHDDAHDQTTVFYVWLSASMRHLAERMRMPGKLPFAHCPALCLFGEFKSGKSALIDLVIAPLFGGRKGDPQKFLREGKFNKDLFSSALLVLDDKGASANLEERRQRGDAIKALIWTELQRMEGKGLDALMVPIFWRLVIAGNFEDSSLNVMPALNDSLKDKLLILRAQRAGNLPADEKEKAGWAARIHAELPAFLAFLLKFRPPRQAELDTRSGVLNFWHPEIAAALLEKQPEAKALEVIDLLGLAPWHGTSTEFFTSLRELDRGSHYERLFPGIDRCGRILSELAKAAPNRVQKNLKDGISHYTIRPKGEASIL